MNKRAARVLSYVIAGTAAVLVDLQIGTHIPVMRVVVGVGVGLIVALLTRRFA